MRERVTVRMTNNMISRLDAWIAAQPHYISRQELVRRCVEFALDREGGPLAPPGQGRDSHESDHKADQ